MKEFNFIEFYYNIERDLNASATIINRLEKCDFDRIYGRINALPFHQLEYDLDKRRLAEILELVRLKFEFAYEYIGLTNMSSRLKTELEKHIDNFDKLKCVDGIDVLYSPVHWILQQHLDAITSHIKIEERNNIQEELLLEQILRGTPKLLFDRKIEPTNEAVVRKEVYKLLIHVFPDTVREIPIAKVSKTYKPDIGIKRLKSAIEYKFIDSEQEAKVAIGGIFEDIQGYEGSSDWTTFYAVFYMTNSFFTQDQIEAEFKLSKVPHYWKPIVVFGQGARSKTGKVANI